ncbi:hypothetical protein [Acinetobacter sp. ESBL14]|uniref:hypothetical protein n=1 Tax=Acinetobacter sp. ESBL14 TaxID=3077329 RepID=UPI002FC63787
MSYQFVGFFALTEQMKSPFYPIDGTTWKDIKDPFHGIGIKLSPSIKTPSSPDDIKALFSAMNINHVKQWLFIEYVCFGGSIDYIYALIMKNGEIYGPIEESALENVERVYIDLMNEFGISEKDALQFKPFDRNFWDE